MRVITWNVNGYSTSEQDVLALLDDADVICLQEIKTKKVPNTIPGWTWFWNPSSSRPHYSGTAMLVRNSLSPELVTMNKTCILADEGRTMSVKLNNGVIVFCVYVPNSGVDKKEPLKRLGLRVGEWDPELRALMEGHQTETVILCGDLNVASREIDVHNPKTLKNKAGFTQAERDSFYEHFGDLHDAWVDVKGKDAKGFTFWGKFKGIKEADKGWRLDYQLYRGIKALDARIYREFDSSDHVPLFVEYSV